MIALQEHFCKTESFQKGQTTQLENVCNKYGETSYEAGSPLFFDPTFGQTAHVSDCLSMATL